MRTSRNNLSVIGTLKGIETKYGELRKLRELSHQEKFKISAQPTQLTTGFDNPFAA